MVLKMLIMKMGTSTLLIFIMYLNHFISHQLARLNPQERFVLRKQTCRIAYFNTT